MYYVKIVSQDRVVSIATGYGLNGRGSNPGGGVTFPHPSRRALVSTQFTIQCTPAVFPGGKAAGAWR